MSKYFWFDGKKVVVEALDLKRAMDVFYDAYPYEEPSQIITDVDLDILKAGGQMFCLITSDGVAVTIND